MIRELIVPSMNNFFITIPDEYIGKQVEFIMFPIEEGKPLKSQNEGLNALGGSLHKYANISKIPLEENAWEAHILDKYK